MVYRGKLSKACAECRAKKTRCDAARPACGQCRRLGRQCSGYRNLDELRFLDQTLDVKRKHSELVASTGTTGACHSISSPFWPSPSALESSELPEATLVHSFPIIKYCLDQGAQFTFFRQYVYAATGPSKTEINWIVPIYDVSKTDGSLADIIAALGLLAMARGNADPTLQVVASRKYSSALKKTQSALASVAMAKSDETLATVILLALHEFIGSGDNENIDRDDTMHLNGAVRLLQLRGPHQFETFLGQRIWHRVIAHTAFKCLKNKRPIPENMLTFHRAVFKTSNPYLEEILFAELLEVTGRLCSLLSPAYHTHDTVANYRALGALDDELDAWAKRLTFRLLPERIDSDLESFFPQQDIYPQHIAASSVNRYRCVRIQVNESRLEYAENHFEILSIAGEDLIQQSRKAEACILRMSEEICYCMPYCLGYRSRNHNVPAGMQDSSMYAGVMNLFPLYFASDPRRIPRPMCEWLLARLYRIVEETGIAQAKSLLAERIIAAANVWDDWDFFCLTSDATG